jgi:hypothetical protein
MRLQKNANIEHRRMQALNARSALQKLLLCIIMVVPGARHARDLLLRVVQLVRQ